MREGFFFSKAPSPLTDSGFKENNTLALRVLPGFRQSKTLLHLVARLIKQDASVSVSKLVFTNWPWESLQTVIRATWVS